MRAFVLALGAGVGAVLILMLLRALGFDASHPLTVGSAVAIAVFLSQRVEARWRSRGSPGERREK